MDVKKIDSVIKVCLYTVIGVLGGALLIYFGWFVMVSEIRGGAGVTSTTDRFAV